MEGKREKGTFLVRIHFREKASWQGQVTWAEENRTVSFRSALELIRLLDEAGETKRRSWEDGISSAYPAQAGGTPEQECGKG